MNSHDILKNISNEDLAVQEEVINIQHVCAKCHKFKKKTNSIYCYNCLGLTKFRWDSFARKRLR